MNSDSTRSHSPLPSQASTKLETYLHDLNASDQLYKEGRFPEALKAYKKILEAIDPDNISVGLEAALMNEKLGLTSLQQGFLKDAEVFLNEALEIYRDLENDAFKTLKVKISLGRLYIAQGKYSDASDNIQTSLNVILEKYETFSEELIASYNGLGALFGKEGRYHLGIEYLEKAEKASLLIDKPECHLETANSYYHMANIYVLMREHDKAYDCIQKALAIREKAYGKSHPEIADCYTTIGNILLDQEQYVKAMENYSLSLDMKSKFLGCDNPSVGDCYNNIGTVYSGLGNGEKAIENYSKGLHIKVAYYGENDFNVAHIYYNIALIFFSQGKSDEALTFFIKALDIQQKYIKKDHPNIADSYTSIGNIYAQRGEFERAETNLLKAIAMKSRIFGSQHYQVKAMQFNLGGLYHYQKAHLNALNCYMKTAKMKTSSFGNEAIRFYLHLSVLLRQNKDFKSAEGYAKKIHDISKKLLKSDSQATCAKTARYDKFRCEMDHNDIQLCYSSIQHINLNQYCLS